MARRDSAADHRPGAPTDGGRPRRPAPHLVTPGPRPTAAGAAVPARCPGVRHLPHRAGTAVLAKPAALVASGATGLGGVRGRRPDLLYDRAGTGAVGDRPTGPAARQRRGDLRQRRAARVAAG